MAYTPRGVGRSADGIEDWIKHADRFYRQGDGFRMVEDAAEANRYW